MKLWGGKKRRGLAFDDKKRRNSLGTESNQKVFSYYTASRRQLDSFERNSSALKDDMMRQRRARKLHKSWFGILVVAVLVVSLGYLLSLTNKPHITVSGYLYRSLADYQKITSTSFGHDLRNRSKLFLQSDSLSKSIMQSLPEAQDVTVSSSFLGHRPEVKISTSAPLAVLTQPGSSYILSTRGRLLLPASESNIDLSRLSILQNQTGVNGKAGEQFISPDETADFSILIAQFKADNDKGVVFLLSSLPHEIQAREQGKTYTVRFLLNNNIAGQYGALRATQNQLQKLGQNPTQYIDVRLADKVYYK